MLIRSQDRKRLLNFEKVTEIRLGDTELEIEILSSGFPYKMGEYKTQEKATKVLNMIQEWYVDAVLTKGISGDMLRVFTKAETSDLNMMIAEKVTSESLKRMCFQMPEDSEVE